MNASISRLAALCFVAAAPVLAAPSPAMVELRRHLTDASINTLTFHSIDAMFETLPVPAGGGKPTVLPRRIAPLDFSYAFEGRDIPAAEFAGRTFTNALLILKDGRIVHEQYYNGTNERTHFLSMSMAKSITSNLIGMAVADGAIESIEDPIVKYVPSLKGSGYDGVTIRQALMMRSGVDWNERYDFGKESPMQRLHDEAIVQNLIRFTDPAARLKRVHPPGEVFNYSTVETGVLGLVLEGAVHEPLPKYMADRWWKRAGMESHGFWLADGEPGVGRAVNGMGFNALLRDFGRIGQMMLDGGKANGQQLLPQAWVKEATTSSVPEPTGRRPTLGYQYQWWTVAGTSAYMAVGLQGQRIFVDPATRTVVVKLSYFPPGEQRAEEETDAFLLAASKWQPRASAAWVSSQPQVIRLADEAGSHAFLSSTHLQHPLDLSRQGYAEEEYLISGQAKVYDWPQGGGSPPVLAEGPYSTRILVRRPADQKRFNGSVIVEPLNPSSPVDLPIMWAQSYEHFMARGYAWVGITIKPNTMKALKSFDPVRYGRVSFPNPAASPRCDAGTINPNAQPTSTADETGLAWEVISQVGTLLKGPSNANPLKVPARRLYLTGQSQTAGYARTYATVFGKVVADGQGKPLYDAYLYSGSPPWQVPLHQCRAELAAGDPRLITPAVGVPVIELFAQGDIGTNVATRRPDADTSTDRFRRYEIAGAPHVDTWEERSFASAEDLLRATGGATEAAETGCSPHEVTPSDFPNRFAFDAAWENLDRWVREGVPPPHAAPLSLRPGADRDFHPDSAFVEDGNGNAVGGVRLPAVDVPTARWVGAKSGPFRCLFAGYKLPFDRGKLRSMYGSRENYVAKVRESADQLHRARWLTTEDAARAIEEANRVAW